MPRVAVEIWDFPMRDYQSGDKSDKSPHSISDRGEINWSSATCRRVSSQIYGCRDSLNGPRGVGRVIQRKRWYLMEGLEGGRGPPS
jgi:hypothetical protein